MAPEILGKETEHSKYNAEKVDIYSLGVMLYFMLFRTYPFTGANPEEIYNKCMEGNVDFSKKNNQISDKMKQLITLMLKYDI